MQILINEIAIREVEKHTVTHWNCGMKWKQSRRRRRYPEEDSPLERECAGARHADSVCQESVRGQCAPKHDKNLNICLLISYHKEIRIKHDVQIDLLRWHSTSRFFLTIGRPRRWKYWISLSKWTETLCKSERTSSKGDVLWPARKRNTRLVGISFERDRMISERIGTDLLFLDLPKDSTESVLVVYCTVKDLNWNFIPSQDCSPFPSAFQLAFLSLYHPTNKMTSIRIINLDWFETGRKIRLIRRLVLEIRTYQCYLSSETSRSHLQGTLHVLDLEQNVRLLTEPIHLQNELLVHDSEGVLHPVHQQLHQRVLVLRVLISH